MSVTSFEYLGFLAVVLTVYYLIRPKWQSSFLLFASLVFYCLAGTPYTIVYLAAATFAAWIAARRIAVCPDQRKAKRILIPALLLIFGLFAVLKYYDFFLENYNAVRGWFSMEKAGSGITPLAALGISYYTLQLAGYLLDCYWRVGLVQESFARFALFACYFPQMTSGPISRYKQVQESLYAEHPFCYEQVTHGLRRMAWGMFKKLVVADRLAIVVNSVYANYEEYHLLLIWGGIFCFSLQLYADFSGCMDIVLGTSECLGITLPENFRNPFFSATIQEFWQRWHITLGTWLKDYIMDPVLKSETWIRLGTFTRRKFGKKWGKRIPTYLGMLILWLAMGLWHGSGWKYIIGEGLWFWAVIILGNMCGKSLQKLKSSLHIKPESLLFLTFQRLRTFVIFSIGLICFRAENMGEVFAVIRAGFTHINERGFSHIRGELGVCNTAMLCLGFLVLIVVELLQNRGADVFAGLGRCRAAVRWSCYLFVCLMILLSLGASGQSFIYAGF